MIDLNQVSKEVNQT